MDNALSLPPEENLDTVMLKVARDVGMDLYEIDEILKNNNVRLQDFHRWKNHPTFLRYLKSEREAWVAASNAPERTKLKAGIVMEMFMDEAHTNLHDRKLALRDRIELSKVVARIAGLTDRPVGQVIPGAGGSGGFRLQININPGEGRPKTINISANHDKVEDVNVAPSWEEDDYDPFTSPDTLGDD